MSNQGPNNFNNVNGVMNGSAQDGFIFGNQEPNPFEASFQEPNFSLMNNYTNSNPNENMGMANNSKSSKQSSPGGDKDKSNQSNDDDAEAKRLKFLERNRIAASKCRQKKKLWMQQLATQADQAASRNKALQMMVNQLKDEVLVLKNQLLAHRNCSCNVIQQYIQTSGQFNNVAARPPIQHAQPAIGMMPNLSNQPSDLNNVHKGN